MTLPASFPMEHLPSLGAVLVDDSSVTVVLHGFGLWHHECDSDEQARLLARSIRQAYDSHENN